MLKTVKKESNNRFFWLILLTLGIYYLITNTRPSEHLSFPPPQIISDSTQNVIKDLKSLQEIALQHSSSRSVETGHLASVEYVVGQLQSLKSLKVTTQEVLLMGQFDETAPTLILHLKKGKSVVFEPRFDFMTARGSGSSFNHNSKLVFVDDCNFTTNEKDFVAIVDPSYNSECNHCDRVNDAIRAGARLVVLLGYPGNLMGYPFRVQPSAGRCGRNDTNIEFMKLVGVVTLSDEATYRLLKYWAIYPNLKAEFKITTAFREFTSFNVLAESIDGNEDNVVLFGSHLDSVRSGPGVNDDGSGAMATLELARVYDRLIHQKNVQKVRFAWWTGEEIGLLGSQYYVDDLKENNPRALSSIKLNIDTDMIASPNYVRGVWVESSFRNETLRRKTQSVSKTIEDYFSRLGLETFEFPFNGRSDFQPFLDQGIPAGGVITGEDEIKSFDSAKKFGGIAGMVLDPCYHQDCDRVDQLTGPGGVILEQNVGALIYLLDHYATVPDLEKELNAF